jgi:hypothetical protein
MSDPKKQNPEDWTAETLNEYLKGDHLDSSVIPKLSASKVKNLLNALCEEPFESDADDEDVSVLRADLVRRARLAANSSPYRKM